ncbi:MAG: metallophosphoesterase [Blastocatellia bacterium]|nr:metallophosphoesterase [Blastocatellia bacterium]
MRIPTLSRRAKIWLVLVLIGILVLIDALAIEPYWIQVTHHHLPLRVNQPLVIAHLSDLHIRSFGWREAKLVELVNREKPDVVVVTGDATGDGGSHETTRQVLRQFHPRLGVWVVRGNWECWRPIGNERAFYESFGAQYLYNQARPLQDNLWIIGLDDEYAGAPDVSRGFADVPSTAVKLALFHSPSLFDRVKGKCDVVLAGHTHGGQVCLPFYGPLWLPRGSGRFLAGWYRENGTSMYVSRGVGTSLFPIRFNCRPEVAFIHVVPSG